jgi:hypothetical protein
MYGSVARMRIAGGRDAEFKAFTEYMENQTGYARPTCSFHMCTSPIATHANFSWLSGLVTRHPTQKMRRARNRPRNMPNCGQRLRLIQSGTTAR